MMMDSVKKENTRLRSQVKRQQEQLNTCQQEIEESRTMLVQLEQLASQVQQDQSRVEHSVSTYLVYYRKYLWKVLYKISSFHPDCTKNIFTMHNSCF